MILKDPRFKSCERIDTTDFSLSLESKSLGGKQISRYITLSVLTCKLLENILHIFCVGQSCRDLRILRPRTSLKLRSHTKFVLCKKYQGYFQLSHNLIQSNKHI